MDILKTVNPVTGGSTSTILRYVWKPILGYSQCQQTGNSGDLDTTMMCAGQSGRDACQVSLNPN